MSGGDADTGGRGGKAGVPSPAVLPRHLRRDANAVGSEVDGSVSQIDSVGSLAHCECRSKDVNASTSAEVHEPQAPLTEAEVIEMRRQRREAIKAKHKSNAPLLVQALEQSMPPSPSTAHRDGGGPQSPLSSANSPQTPHGESPPPSPAAFAVADDEELVDRRNSDSAGHDEGPSAADYDPNQDPEEDRPGHKKVEVAAEVAAKDVVPSSKEFDMFADDDDDMFALEDTERAKGTKVRALDQSLLDNWDYPDGHYRIILGELLDGRYAVQQQIGKGTFASVVRALDSKTNGMVAVKIACNNDTMYKAGQKEMDMLQLLNEHDVEDRKHIIRLLRSFHHKGHLCLVFESLSADLREVLKKFGRNVGLNLKAIRSYAQQMFLGLSHLKKCHILHADLKPDNILVSEKRSLLKICDLGTATFVDDADITPYLVSRFYRAPEVILGLRPDHAIDMWSIGCTLFELYTGRILFAGADNNQMLRAIQECRGKFPPRMLKRASLADRHFDSDATFFSQTRDPPLRQAHPAPPVLPPPRPRQGPAPPPHGRQPRPPRRPPRPRRLRRPHGQVSPARPGPPHLRPRRPAPRLCRARVVGRGAGGRGGLGRRAYGHAAARCLHGHADGHGHGDAHGARAQPRPRRDEGAGQDSLAAYGVHPTYMPCSVPPSLCPFPSRAPSHPALCPFPSLAIPSRAVHLPILPIPSRPLHLPLPSRPLAPSHPVPPLAPTRFPLPAPQPDAPRTHARTRPSARRGDWFGDAAR